MTRFERWAIWTTSILTAVTGFGYAWTKYFLTTADPWAAINHPLEPWFLRLHVIAAPLFVFAFGLIALRHVWKHVATGVRRARRSGLTAALFILPMVATGYLVQVVTHTGWLRAMALSHIAFGTAYLAGIAAHQIALGRRAADGSGRAEEVERGNGRPPAVARGAADAAESGPDVAAPGRGVKPDRLDPRRVG